MGAASHQAECKQHLCDDSQRPYCKVDEGSALKAARSRQRLLIGLKMLLLDRAALKHKPFKSTAPMTLTSQSRKELLSTLQSTTVAILIADSHLTVVLFLFAAFLFSIFKSYFRM